MRLNWDDTRIFLALARTGTLSGVAQTLGLGVATVSRRVDRLEQALGVPLFLRHQSGYRLTDQGEALLPRAEEAEQAIQGFSQGAGAEAEVAGLVRLASFETIVAPVIVPALAPLLARHSGLDVEILFSAAVVNLHRRDADLALRLLRPEHGHLLVRQVGVLGVGLYGPPSGARPERFVTFPFPEESGVKLQVEWARAFGADQAPRLAVNTLAGQVEAVARGVGVGVLPHLLAREAGLRLLADRLPNGSAMERPIYMAIHADLAASRRVRAVADTLIQALEARRAELAEP
ncbi:LysR family transcriptional regulator [Thioclava sp. NG1]|uniref:LysR family transcriptional regulator n=1 Tax=Thioclava sp. NG1 TaxID=2182426 RepID=UPI0018EE7327|nr:LysR family transcriptional regulator [Thioclava sp. NG1]